MCRLRLVVVLVAVVSGLVPQRPATAGGIERLDAHNGFLDARFGDRIEEFQGLLQVKDMGAIRMYVDVVDRKSYRNARLEGIAYLFHGDRLFAVSLVPLTESDAEELLAAFHEDYGEPRPETRSPEWRGRRVRLQWMPNPDGPAHIVFMDREVVERIASWGVEPFDILYRLR
jgi:hypothetical protein